MLAFHDILWKPCIYELNPIILSPLASLRGKSLVEGGEFETFFQVYKAMHATSPEQIPVQMATYSALRRLTLPPSDSRYLQLQVGLYLGEYQGMGQVNINVVFASN